MVIGPSTEDDEQANPFIDKSDVRRGAKNK